MKTKATRLLGATALLAAAVLAHPSRADDLDERAGTAGRSKEVSIVGEARAEVRSARKAKPKDRFLFAVVRFDGFLDRGSGVKQTLRTDTGIYRVFFDRDVTGCSHVVSVSGTGTDDVHGVADAAQVGGKPRGLYVNTYGITVDTVTGTLQRKDAPFHLQVICPAD